MPLAFLVLPSVKLLGQSTLGEQDCQHNKKELFWHNSLQPGFFRTLRRLYLRPVACGSVLTAPGSGPAARGSGPAAPGSGLTAACDRGPASARNRGFIIGRDGGLIGVDQSGTITPPV